jgi:aryl-alcohol dehydrogenase-like predicted oxidoreductase
MQSRALGPSGVEASVIGLGTWAIGGWMWGGTEEEASVRAIRASLDRGITLIDTAPVYGFGLAEQIVGRAIEGRRDEVVIATKCGLRWDLQEGEHLYTDEKGNSIYKYLHPDSIRMEVEQSLKRLGVETIDLYQTHWQEPTTPIERTMECLLKLKEEGKIRAIGVSNATVDQMEQYRALGPLDTDQEKYSMLDRELEAEQLPYCRQHGMGVLAYSPMAMGLLTGKITPDRAFPEDDVRSKLPRFRAENRRSVLQMLGELKPIADGHGISLAQLAVAWTVHQPGLTHALVGARSDQQAEENVRSGEVTLSDAELQQIDQVLNRYAEAVA